MVEIATLGLRLLIVDDDNLIRWALAQEFSAHGIAVSICHDGKEALDRIHAAHYDLAILDVHLPDANGIEILEEIKRVSPGTRVIVISADADTANIRRAIAAGAEQFIEKPFDPAVIGARVLDMFRDYPVPRRHPRYACRIPVRISLLAPIPAGTPIDLNKMSGIAEDVGGGGARVATNYPLAAGQVVRVRAGAADTADPLVHFIPPHATAEVRWTTMAPGGFTAGLSFRNTVVLREASPEGGA